MRSADLLPDRRAGWWLVVALVATTVLALVPVLFESRFYFADDTQGGAYGIWYSIGEHLRAGSLPLFEPSRWMAGNYAAEGQWGIFNPLVMLIGLVTVSVPNAVVLSTGVKVFFLVVASAGVHLLARSYGARPEWACVGAVLTPLAGFVVYMDAASWVTGLMTWALLPGTWWALRRTALAGGNPLLPFALGYLLITVGYVHGTLMLVVVITGTLVEAGLDRSRAAFLRTTGVGVLLGLVALAVYLPGVLSAGVTTRDDGGILNDNFLSPDLSGLAASTVATARPWFSGFWAPPVPAPVLYVSWLLPALLLVDWHRAAERARVLAAPLLLLVVSMALVFGPAELGPLRFPVRVMPYVVLPVLLLLVVLLSVARARRSRGREVAAVAVVVVGTFAAFAELPGAWESFVAAGLLAAAGVLVVGRVLERGPAGSPVVLVAVVLAVTSATTLLQHRTAPASPLIDFGLPAEVSAYDDVLPGVQGDTLVVGVPLRLDPRPWDETLRANAWYLNDASVQNVYSPLQYRSYAEDLCTSSQGETCWEALGTLFTDDPTTGVPLVDLLAISNLQIVRRADGGTVDPFADARPPAGWSETERGEDTLLWTRDRPVPTAGGVVWSSPGTTVTQESGDGRGVRLRVDAVGAQGGSVVLSRLAWPGYTVTGGTLGEPVRDYLVRVDVPAGSEGSEVTVSFSPPGWAAELVSLAVAVVAAVGWGALAAVRRLRRRAAVDA